MDPDLADLTVGDVVISTAGRDAGKLFYVIKADALFLTLVNGKNRTMERPKKKKRKHTQKVLRSESAVAEKLKAGDEVLSSELRKELAGISRNLQSKALGG